MGQAQGFLEGKVSSFAWWFADALNCALLLWECFSLSWVQTSDNYELEPLSSPSLAAALPGQFPYYVSLYVKNPFGPVQHKRQHYCGGSLIAPNVVLTTGKPAQACDTHASPLVLEIRCLAPYATSPACKLVLMG